MYKVLLSRDAEKYLARLDKQTRGRIIEAIQNLPAGEVKKLKGIEAYRLRVGDYRVIFERDSRILTIHVIKIAPRGQIYK